jgi:hypothetical protein
MLMEHLLDVGRSTFFFSPGDVYVLADKFTKNTLNAACFHVVLWLHERYTYLKAKHSAMDQNVVKLLTCCVGGYRVRALSWTQTTLNAVLSVPTLALGHRHLFHVLSCLLLSVRIIRHSLVINYSAII